MPNDPHYVHINFEAKNVIGEVELKEPDKCFEWKWFPIDDLPKDIFTGHQQVIPAFLNKIVFVDGSI